MKACFCVMLLVTLFGCGKRQNLIYDQPSLGTEGRYEIAWIDPQLIASDTLYTLIRSERIDSIYVNKPGKFGDVATSINFRVEPAGCPVAINLTNAKKKVILPLFVQTLPPGHYKLTFNVDRFTGSGHRAAVYYLAADFCTGTTQRALVGR